MLFSVCIFLFCFVCFCVLYFCMSTVSMQIKYLVLCIFCSTIIHDNLYYVSAFLNFGEGQKYIEKFFQVASISVNCFVRTITWLQDEISCITSKMSKNNLTLLMSVAKMSKPSPNSRYTWL